MSVYKSRPFSSDQHRLTGHSKLTLDYSAYSINIRKMNTLFSVCLFVGCLVLCSMALDTPKKNDMEFLNGLPMDVIDEFITTQLDRTLTMGERDTRLMKWAEKQGNKVHKQYVDFYKKIRKEGRKHLQKAARAIHLDFVDGLHETFDNPKLTHSGVCTDLNSLTEKMAVRMRAIGEKGPRSHTPCNAVKDE